MFDRIAPRYDLMNRLMTFGQDLRWRRHAVRALQLPPLGRVLDLGAGTGDLAREVLRQQPGAHIVAADFSRRMIAIGRRRPSGGEIAWVVSDAHHLPFAPAAFDGVVSGFLLRNVHDLPRALDEQRRVLKAGGRLVALDTSPIPPGPLRPLLRFHLHRVIPWVGRLVTGEGEAYNYLPQSTDSFHPPPVLAEKILAAGFHRVSFTLHMFRTVALHTAIGPGAGR
jgi:demethylmenaquinone methyltransferase/2-methoxy-6-polyprenyl-1,4-benzoquinol methylase